MKRILFTILVLLSFSCSKSQFYYHLIDKGAAASVVSNVKNIQAIDNLGLYSAFGFLDYSRTNKLSYYYRIGDGHLTNGKPYYREYNVVANHWYDTVRIATSPTGKDARDVYGTRMDNDSTVMFLQWTNNCVAGDCVIDLQIIKCDSNNNFSAPIDFNWSVLGARLQRSFVYGHVVAGDNAGEYYEPIIQLNQDTGNLARRRISVLKTTDYWNTYTEVGVIWENTTTRYSETALANLGSGKFLALLRNDQSGTLTGYESTNSCANWTARGTSNLYWYISGDPEIPCIYTHDGVFDIIYECRDAEFVSISKNNTVASNFGITTPVYNEPELYAPNFGAGGNPSLGYPAMIKMPNSVYLVVYAFEASNSVANLMFTRDDLTTDPDGIPDPPQLTMSNITTTSFKVDLSGYTDEELENVRWFVQDVSTVPDFSTFATLKYRIPTSGAFPAVPMQNIRTLGLWDIYNSATTGTTYYLRFKACNNEGCSAYTTTSVTTL